MPDADNTFAVQDAPIPAAEVKPEADPVRTLCNQAERKLESLLTKAHTMEQQQQGLAAALSHTYNDIIAQKAYISGLRAALGEAPLPNSLPQ